MDRIEEPVDRVLAHVASSPRHFQGPKQVLAGENQGKQKTEHKNRRNAPLMTEVAALQQVSDSLIMKELMNLVFTGSDV